MSTNQEWCERMSRRTSGGISPNKIMKTKLLLSFTLFLTAAGLLGMGSQAALYTLAWIFAPLANIVQMPQSGG